MSASSLQSVFSTTRDQLEGLGVEDEFLRDLIASRLTIERVGEVTGTGGLGWWDSRVLTSTGRDRLSEVTPRTWVQARIDLAIEVGQEAEGDRLPTDSVALFSMTPQIETRVEAAIEAVPADANEPFTALEEFELAAIEDGWTDPIVDELGGDADPARVEEATMERSNVFKLRADAELTPDEVDADRADILSTLVKGYGRRDRGLSRDEFSVPYYGLTANFDGAGI